MRSLIGDTLFLLKKSRRTKSIFKKCNKNIFDLEEWNWQRGKIGKIAVKRLIKRRKFVNLAAQKSKGRYSKNGGFESSLWLL